MIKKHFWKIVILAAVVAIGGSLFYSSQTAEQANDGVVIKEHIKGNEEASVTLVEYSDFQCPACGQFYPRVKELMEEYGDQLRFEYRHFPLTNIHPFAAPAARASEAASQQGKFWEMHDKLFEGQSVWSKSGNPSAYFIQYAEELDLDIDTFKRHLDASLISDAVNDGFNDARSRGFTGTPTFLLNGETMNFSTFDEFRSQIEEAMGVTPSSEEDIIETEVEA